MQEWQYAAEFKRVCKALKKAEKARGTFMAAYYEGVAILHDMAPLAVWKACDTALLRNASIDLSQKTGLTLLEALKIIRAWREQLDTCCKDLQNS